eukprot:CAMPEP_0204402240 /NCGR_PEP_ID=MMETSP0470-20130426/5183_2 /ASSEMBLY_ACC=CAM_ASM_000385 /TAXON_ID=2969 /ORGANISM="Oxyrrhis marina" /LENGTH=182 /DNA_ID=CAMNT_0051397315 /DNA_START=28 /DNA_END=572 /DNA_ORIENTATION=-
MRCGLLLCSGLERFAMPCFGIGVRVAPGRGLAAPQAFRCCASARAVWQLAAAPGFLPRFPECATQPACSGEAQRGLSTSVAGWVGSVLGRRELCRVLCDAIRSCRGARRARISRAVGCGLRAVFVLRSGSCWEPVGMGEFSRSALRDARWASSGHEGQACIAGTSACGIATDVTFVCLVLFG